MMDQQRLRYDNGLWTLEGPKGEYKLERVVDFFRLSSLLDESFSVAAGIVERSIVGGGNEFPMWKIVAAAFISTSRLASEKAAEWLSSLSGKDLIELQPYLLDVVSSKWASQKTRHTARRYLNRARN